MRTGAELMGLRLRLIFTAALDLQCSSKLTHMSGTAMPLLLSLLWTLDVWWAMMPVRANFPSPAIAIAVCLS
jgi:hypothetical protein